VGATPREVVHRPRLPAVKVAEVTARAIVGLLGLAALFGVTAYLLFQIPWEYGVGGIVVLVGILLVLGVDEPDALG